MKITVVGGSKGTGAQVVRIAAAAGHQVTCLSRSGTATSPEGVRELTGDALDPEVARTAVAGADAVVVTVGGTTGSDRHRAEVTRSIIAAMAAAGVRRLVVHSSLGVGDSMELMPAPARLFARTVLARALADHAEQEAATEASGLDWTIVRPGGLTDGPATGSSVAQETAEGRPMKGRISRADVATQIIATLDDPATVGRALALGTA
ncbi:MAG: NAD(P)-binding oxidoreductase [Propionicimonas sp.]